MATPEPVTAPLEQWLGAWGHWLDLWWQSGLAIPNPEAEQALTQWLAAGQATDWPELLHLGQRLLAPEASAEDRADTYLEMNTWYHGMRNALMRERLLSAYGSSATPRHQ